MKRYGSITKICFGLSIAGILILVVGCGGEEVTMDPGVRVQPTAAPEKKDADMTKRKGRTLTKQVWSYDPTGKRDPFEVPPPPEDIGGQKNPAIVYDLDQMWVDGIIWGAGRDVAHIILPSRDDIFVSVGDELGINHGRVKQIRGDQVIVEEIYVDPANPSEIHIIEKILELKASKKKGRRRR